MIDYKGYFNNVFLEGIQSIFNEELQAEAWGGGNYARYTDFLEVTITFMDSCELVLEDYIEHGLSEKQRDNLRRLYEVVDDYDLEVPRGSGGISRSEME